MQLAGASSGIGHCAARHLAAPGAVSGDVTREADLRKVAETAVERFGRIDTWINNAAVYLQGRVRGRGSENAER